ncbi:MAG: transketolase family protein [Defluviitaleaceae bacterium]|nr:transketolase family protein [Defluviitaleaceae bacterium]
MSIIYDGSLDKIVYKTVFGETMEALAKADPDVVYLDADLMASIGTRDFWKRNPKQAINCGIAEANMIGVAAGLSSAGKKPYCHTFGPFASRRVFDQAFLSVAYGGNNVRIFGSDPGVTAAFNGGTHMPFEDIALYRAVPNATVLEISDGAMLKTLMWQLKDYKGLSYTRLTRKAYPTIYSDDHKFTIGKGEVVRAGKDAAIIACGLMVGEAMAAAQTLAAEGVDVQVIDMFTIKPLDVDLVLNAAKTGMLITAENHNIIGGLGDAVAATLLEAGVSPKFKRIGVNDRFGQVGPQDFLQKEYGLTAENIVNTLRGMA